MRTPVLILLIVASFSPVRVLGADLTVFAAASTVQVMKAVRTVWNTDNSDDIRLIFGSSGALARQIETGAPADIFFSANRKWVDYLTDRDLVRSRTRQSVLKNRLVLVAPAERPQPASFDPVSDLSRTLGARGRLSMGDPRHVPAGIYAKEALTKLGIWPEMSRRTARTQNVRLALALVERSETPLGIVYRTDALQSSRVRILITFSENLHSPIRYEAVATNSNNPRVARLLDFLQSDGAHRIYRKYGFTPG
jgi:molybdate transport system substrate-binding protein